MSKPTTLPRWATNLTNNDEPSSGQKDTGWTPGQDGVSDYDNWIKYWNYKWAEWLDARSAGVFNVVHRNWYNNVEQVGYTSSGGGSGSPFLDSESTLIQGGHLRLLVTDTGQVAGGAFGPVMQPPQFANHVQVLEWDVDATLMAGAGVADADLFMGLMEIGAYDNSKGIVAIYANGSDAVWKVIHNATTPGPATTFNTGITRSAVNLHRMKIVWAGSGYAGGPYAKFYIDGALAHTATTNLPDNNAEYMYIRFNLIGLGPNDGRAFISPLTWTQARTLTDGNTLL